MLCEISSMGLVGLQAYTITIETDVSVGMALFEVVGLPDAAIKESRERVRSALKNCGFEFPVNKITVNLAPADIKKTGPLYDLPIFLSILQASEQIGVSFDEMCFMGELSLGGEIRRCTGILPMVIEAKKKGFKSVFVPKCNEREASVVEGINVYGVSHVKELLNHLCGQKELEKTSFTKEKEADSKQFLDFSDVKGQVAAKRALEIAAAGGHNVLLLGSPGSGKSMLAKRLPSILPKLTFEEAIESTNVHSIAGLTSYENPLLSQRPFRSPHHTISAVGLSGGGTPAKPGEISLAHNGVLFMDELPEFRRDVKEVLRQPVEDGVISITRAGVNVSYPCSVMLVAAMNPCPCGYYGHPTRQCSCKNAQVSRYLSKVSGPLLDRLDLHIDVAPVEFDELTDKEKSESSDKIRARVEKTREVQNLRYKNLPFCTNARLTSAYLEEFCPMTDGAKKMLKGAFERMGLSARAYDRLLKVARTIADLDDKELIDTAHIAESIQYRSMDRKYWA